jgi:hypothetical protein
MKRPLKTYGWTAIMSDGLRVKLSEREHIVQCRAVVAATSMAAAARLVGRTPRQLFNMGETWNATEKAVCEAQPGTIFCAPLSQSSGYVAYNLATDGMLF